MKTKLIFLLAMVCGLPLFAQSRLPMRSESSTNIENTHVFSNSRGKYLYNLNAYNSTGTVYVQLYDSYTAALPAAATGTTFNSTTDALTISAPAQATWTTGTRARLTTSGALPAALTTGRDYWLIKVTTISWKFAESLDKALAGSAIDLTDTGSGTATLTVLPMPITPLKTTVNGTASYTFTSGRPFNDGVYAVFSSTDTNFTAIATASGLFDAVYGN